MSNSTSGFRSSVSAAAALLITALMAWSIDAYARYVGQDFNPSLSTAQIESANETSDFATRNG